MSFVNNATFVDKRCDNVSVSNTLRTKNFVVTGTSSLTGPITYEPTSSVINFNAAGGPNSNTITNFITNTNGDILSHTGGSLNRLPIGSIRQTLAVSSSSVPAWEDRNYYDAIVDASGNADYLLPSDAFNDGNTTVYVRNGTYTESTNIVIPDRGSLIGESYSGVIITFPGVNSIIADGNGGTVYSGGTISVTNNSDAVVGVGTSFLSLTGVGSTAYILVGGTFRRVESVTDDFNLTLTSPYEGTTSGGITYIAQEMYTGIHIQSLTIKGGLSNGLFLRGVRLTSVQKIAVANASGLSPLSNIRVEDSGNIEMSAIVSQNAQGRGVTFDRTYFAGITNLQSVNNEDHGLFVDNNSYGIIFDTCVFSSNGQDGVRVENSSTSNIYVVDSTVHSNNSQGINVSSTAGVVIINSCSIENNASFGIDFDGSDNTVNGCNIRNNLGTGIAAGDNGTMTGNLIFGNGNNGISMNNDTNCAIVGNRIVNNTATGIDGTGINGDSSITGNYISGNVDAITISGTVSPYTITSNIITGNTGDGIDILDGIGCVISSNSISGGIKGIDIGSSSIDCIVSGNRLSGTSDDGIELSSTVQRCSLSGNIVIGAGVHGMDIDGSLCSISGNTIANSTLNGIDLNGPNCSVTGNVISGNSGDGIDILSLGINCVVSSNRIIGNTKGIDVNSSATGICINGNHISGGSGDGVEIGSHNCVVTGNISTTNTGDGIMILGTSNNSVVSSNRCTGNTDDGVDIDTGATNTVVTGNNLEGNGTSLEDTGTLTLLSNNYTP